MSGCAKYLEWMQRELDGELSELEKKMLRKHLEQCPFCREEYAGFRMVADMFSDAEMIEPPAELTDLIMAEVMRMETVTEPPVTEASLIRHLKGIGLLVILAGLNAALFGSWLISLLSSQFGRLQLELWCRILAEAFMHFEIIGVHTADALQTVINSIIHALPWDWIGLYILMVLLIVLGTWKMYRKGGDEI